MPSDSPEGVEFRRQLLLTEDAKKFVLARQLYYLQSSVYEVVDTIKIVSFYGLFQVLICASSLNPGLIESFTRSSIY